MAGRTGRRRVTSTSPLVDLDVVFADDERVDAIATRPWGQPGSATVVGGAERFRPGPSGNMRTRDPLLDLFNSWRDELESRPLPDPPRVGRVTLLEEQPPAPTKRSMRASLSIAAAIGALLIGTASVGSKDAPPGSALFAVTRVLWPEKAESVMSASRVRTQLDEARMALEQGRAADAQVALGVAAAALENVDELDGRSSLQQDFDTLTVAATPRGVVPPPVMVGAGTTQIDRPRMSVAAPGSAGPAAAAVAAGSPVAPSSAAGPPLLNATAGVLLAAAPSGSTGHGSSGSPTAAEPAAVGADTPVGGADPIVPGTQPADSVSDTAPVVGGPPTPTETASTPPAPPAPGDPPAETSSDQPTATEQSPPAPTPSESDGKGTTPADGGPSDQPGDDGATDDDAADDDAADDTAATTDAAPSTAGESAVPAATT